ncbi:MAG TPA: PHP domain-containing protein [Clostridia bacterium]|nr:PHP domain-containing protein [Clostridia bacterium]HRX42080.1 PHP domain-containing protein [Clostridia bacterium]
MNDYYLKHVDNLNNPSEEMRLLSLEKLVEGIEKGEIIRPVTTKDVNNHIHTSFSFSPYSPTKALWMAYTNGLETAGIMDHDTVAGCMEFAKAGKIIGMATTGGMEIRVNMDKTPLAGRKINNPDQNSIVYMAFHGIPHTRIETVQNWVRPYAKARNRRNADMVERLNDILKPYDMKMDFKEDVASLSEWKNGGSITERHISFALAFKLTERFGKGDGLVDFYKNTMKLPLSAKNEALLLDVNNPVYEYDLLSAIKSDMIDMFYLPATDECPDVAEALEVAAENGCISAYAYLGDVGQSVTGDKKPQKFEDDYIGELFSVIKKLGFNAVTYMPSRNTMEQLRTVKDLCVKHDLFQISGEDINSPRQGFICKAMRDEAFSNLVDSTWALIGHEKLATDNLDNSMFGEQICSIRPTLSERIPDYMSAGRNIGGR